VQHGHRALGQSEHEIGAILEIHVKESARQPRAARDVIHRQRIEPDIPSGRFRGVDDLRATTLLLFLSAFNDVIHGDGE
jgi:hypothetical protein